MSLPFIIPKSIYETATCLGHCLDGSTALDFWHLASQDGSAIIRLGGSKMERLARLGHNDGIFKAHKQREGLPGVIWPVVSNAEESEWGVKTGRG